MSVLKEILKNKKEELTRRKNALTLKEIKIRLKDAPATKNFKTAIQRGRNKRIRLIAEIKKASPSGRRLDSPSGSLRKDFNISEIVSAYSRKDVHAISVLTEERFFQGSLGHLDKTRQITEKPLLRKDFIFDDYQIYESRLHGADAILLIAAALDKSQLTDFHGLARELSLECLAEVHNLEELDKVLYCGADIIGINNRNLNTLNVRLDTTLELLKHIPDSKITVSESGINTREDVETIEATKIDAMLVGTTFMKAKDIGAKIDELLHNSDSTDYKA